MAIIEKKNLFVIYKNGMIPVVPFLHIKETILGEKYNLSIIFCTKKESKKLNKKYRGKNQSTNVLSFPLDKNTGEIYIQREIAKQDAKKFKVSFKKFLHLLVIHGVLHLKGHGHSSTMEKLEDFYLKKFLRVTKKK